MFSALYSPKMFTFICKQDFNEQIMEVLLHSRPNAGCWYMNVIKNQLVMVFVFTHFSLVEELGND